MQVWQGVLLAVLAPSGVIVTLLERMHRRNNRDHEANAGLLRSIDSKVDKIDGRLDKHIEWHLEHDEKHGV